MAFDTTPSTAQRRSNSARSASVPQLSHGATRAVDSLAQFSMKDLMSTPDTTAFASCKAFLRSTAYITASSKQSAAPATYADRKLTTVTPS